MMSQSELARGFLALHYEDQPLLLPNPWDEGSAKLLAFLGFKALATTSSGFAATKGLLDGSAGRDDALAQAALIAAVTALPVSADLENGFARDPQAAAETYRQARQTGLAGASIEDYDRDAKEIYDIGLASERVAAAAEAFHSGDARLVLTGRAENFLHDRPDLDDTIRRLQAFVKVGAHVVYAPGLRSLDEIKTVCAAVAPTPVNALVSAGGPTAAEFAAVGVRRVSLGSGLARMAYGAFYSAAKEIKEHGTFHFAKSGLSFSELNSFMRGR